MTDAAKWVSAVRRGRRWGIRISLNGLFFLFGTTVIGLAAIDADANLLLLVFGVCLGSAVLSLIGGWRALRRLDIARSAPASLVAGQPSEIRYSITNRCRWARAHNIHLVDVLPTGSPLGNPEAYVPLLRPGESVTVSVPVLPRRRGRLCFVRIGAATRFPFGLLTKYVTLPIEWEATVFPSLGRLAGDVSAASRSLAPATGGGMSARGRGDEEYYGVREYRIGDNPRRIHWRRSARTGQLMIREMARTRDRQLWCVLGTRIDPGNAAQIERLEQAISCAATVICDALERGVRVGLICSGEPLLVLPPGGGRAHRPRLLRELAVRDPNPNDDLVPHIQRLSWPGRWWGACLLFAAEATPDIRFAAQLLGQALGPTTLYAPGTPLFDSVFIPPGNHAERHSSGTASRTGQSAQAGGGMNRS